MEQRTKINAEDGRQDLVITRQFDLPVELLFQAHTDPEIIEQWMGSKVVKLDAKKHGSYQLEKKDDKGNVLFAAAGVIHEFIPNQKIIRTFEMANAQLGVQLEVYEFEPVGKENSKLHMHLIYESVALRDQQMKLPFKQGINMAHDRMQAILEKLK